MLVYLVVYGLPESLYVDLYFESRQILIRVGRVAPLPHHHTKHNSGLNDVHLQVLIVYISWKSIKLIR